VPGSSGCSDATFTRVIPASGDDLPWRGPHDLRVTTYEMVIEGELSDRFGASFADMSIERRAGATILTGEIRDQAQLQGVIARVADLGLDLRSLAPVAAGGQAARSPEATGEPFVDPEPEVAATHARE
jgi:hypothetical protein